MKLKLETSRFATDGGTAQLAAELRRETDMMMKQAKFYGEVMRAQAQAPDVPSVSATLRNSIFKMIGKTRAPAPVRLQRTPPFNALRLHNVEECSPASHGSTQVGRILVILLRSSSATGMVWLQDQYAIAKGIIIASSSGKYATFAPGLPPAGKACPLSLSIKGSLHEELARPCNAVC